MFGLFFENTKIAFHSIRSQVLRTSLTVIIIALGIFSLVGILTVVKALDNELVNNFAAMGSNTFTITQYSRSEQIDEDSENRPNPVITYQEVRRFMQLYTNPMAETSLYFDASSNAEVKYDNLKTDPEIKIVGVDENFLSCKGLELEKGRNFNNFDIKNSSNVCLIGFNLKENLFKGANPIDKMVSIKGTRFRVIGMLEEKGATFGKNQDLRVLIPNQIARAIFSSPDINYEVDLKMKADGLIDNAVGEASLVMRNVRGLRPIEPDNFGVNRSDDLIQILGDNTKMLGVIAWVIGIITVFGSSIALMNIMLVSVSERTREIGIRKSLGAKKRTIAWQFFTETFVISQLGGILGIILGILLGSAVAIALGFEFTIPWGAMIAAFLITLFVTIFSGLYPAIKASRLDPIEALRYE